MDCIFIFPFLQASICLDVYLQLWLNIVTLIVPLIEVINLKRNISLDAMDLSAVMNDLVMYNMWCWALQCQP